MAGGEAPLDTGDNPGQALVSKDDGNTKAKPISRTGRRGPKIAFRTETPTREDLAWVDGNNIVINSEHPAYKKVDANLVAKRHHCLFAIAMAVQRFCLALIHKKAPLLTE